MVSSPILLRPSSLDERKIKRITVLQRKPVNSGLTSHSTKASPVFSDLVQKMTKRFHHVK